MCTGTIGRGNNVARGREDLKNIVCDTSWTAGVVVIPLVMYTGLFNMCSINGIGTSPLDSRRNLCLGMKDRYKA